MDVLQFFSKFYLCMFIFSTSYFYYWDGTCRERKKLFNKEGLSNKTLTDFSLWSKSGVESSIACFFYNPETGVCTGHALQFYSTEPSIEQEGSLYYSMAVDKTDCADILANDPDTSDGVYVINPLDGRGPFKVFCDMTTDGGGWTVFLRQEDGSENFNREWSEYKDGFGDLASEFWLGDALSKHNGMKFTTTDRDNDINEVNNCASSYPGGWWFYACREAHLTGTYNDTTSAMGVIWFQWRGHRYSLKKADMKMRPT